MGVQGLPIIAVPVDVRVNAETARMAAMKAVNEIVGILTRQEVASEYANMHRGTELEENLGRPTPVLSWEPVEGPDSFEEANAFLYDRGWTDGLPVIPATKTSVERMLSCTDRDPKEVIGKIPPRWGLATVERVAVNAVMAGCLPEHLPLILCAVDVLARPEFDIFSAQATTAPVAPMMLVNGPLAKKLKINGSFGLFGPCWRSNAAMGRAVRLVLVNIGGGLPGTTDKAVQGQPGKYSFCIAENEDESPWEPFHVEQGFDRNVSTVTMYGIQATHNLIILDNTPDSTLVIAADAMCTIGCNTMYNGGRPCLVLNPRLANYLSRAGYSKDDVKRYLFEHARVPLSRFPINSLSQLRARRPNLDFSSPQSLVPVCDDASQMVILVAGGAGTHITYLPGFSMKCWPTTVPIALKDGTPVESIEDFLKAEK